MSSSARTDPSWWVSPLLAVQFLTRVPVPGLDRLDAAEVRVGLGRCLVWFPAVGGLVTLATAAVLETGLVWWPATVAVLVALAVEARLTGAFHEDAVADFCDAIGGAMTRERTLEILKDSRVGSYGALALVLAVGLRAALLVALAESSSAAVVLAALLASGALGRWAAVSMMRLVPPAVRPEDRPGTEAVVKDIAGAASARTWVQAGLGGLPFVVPLAMVEPAGLGLAVVGGALALFWLRRLLLRRLGGQTGDCLGFAVYLVQLVVLLAVVTTT